MKYIIDSTSGKMAVAYLFELPHEIKINRPAHFLIILTDVYELVLKISSKVDIEDALLYLMLAIREFHESDQMTTSTTELCNKILQYDSVDKARKYN
jgi:hypothetical protein